MDFWIDAAFRRPETATPEPEKRSVLPASARAIGALLVTVGVLVGCAIGNSPDPGSQVAANQIASEITDIRSASGAPESLSAADVRLFSRIFDRIKQSYVTPVDNSQLLLAASEGIKQSFPDPTGATDQELLVAAAQGMLQSLDSYSVFLDRTDYRDWQEITRGKFAGLGIRVTKRDGDLKIISPIDGTPAMRAGLKAGDVITRADGVDLAPLSEREAIELLRGPAGTEVTITIRRKDVEDFDVTVTRAVVQVPSVVSKLEGDIGYIRITQFNKNTGEKVEEAISTLLNSSGGAVNAFVLDLRNNPGGLLDQSVVVADAFLEGGLVVSTKGRYIDQPFFAGGSDLTGDRPLLVLINHGSASASEIVAGALQDLKRAILIGETSFGKGSVQTIYPIDSGRGVKLTTARYFTPSGRTVDGGILPDIEIADDEETEADEQLERAMKLAVELSGGPSVVWGAGTTKK